MVASVGNELRRDDGAGPAVLAELLDRPVCSSVWCGRLGSPFDLLGLWDGAQLAVVVDAVRAGGTPGEVHVVELVGLGTSHGSDPEVDPGVATGTGAAVLAPASVSSHGTGLVEVLRLARSLGTAPARVMLVGIAGSDFGHGAGLSEPVRRGVGEAAEAVAGLLRAASDASCARDDGP